MSKILKLILISIISLNGVLLSTPELHFIDTTARLFAVCKNKPQMALIDRCGELSIKNLTDGKIILKLQGIPLSSIPDRSDCLCKFSPDSRFVAYSTFKNDSVGIFDLQRSSFKHLNYSSASQNTELDYYSPIKALDFSPNNKILAVSSSKEIMIWDVESGAFLQTLYRDEYIENVLFSPSGKYLVSSSKHGRSIKIWSTENWNLIETITISDSADCISFSPNEKFFAVGPDAGKIKLFKLPEFLMVGSFHIHKATLFQLPFSPDSNFLFTGDPLRCFQVWDTRTCSLEYSSALEHTCRFYSISVSPCGKYIATGSADWTAKIWEFGKCKSIFTIKTQQQADFVTFSSTGQHLVVQTSNGIEVWKLWPAPAIEICDSKKSSQCIVCMDKPKQSAFVPCGHLCMCLDCAAIVIAQSGTCPICRACASGTIRIYT